jgi:hypothetical protein
MALLLLQPHPLRFPPMSPPPAPSTPRVRHLLSGRIPR